MYHRGKTRMAAGILLIAVLLGGCARTPKTKTILLPEKTQAENSELSGESSGYTIQNLYSRDFSTFLGMESAAFLQNTQDHRLRLLTTGDEWELNSDLLDYRYGFYDREYAVSGDKIMYIWDWWNMESGLRAGGVQQFLSPDGKYMVFPTGMFSYRGAQMYLLNLETQDQTLLLDGDEMGYPGDEYFLAASWSRDASLLGYGFFPRNSQVWMRDAEAGKPYVLHFWDLEKQESAGALQYVLPVRPGEITEKSLDLTGTKFYVERDGYEVLAAFVQEGFSEKNGKVYTDGVIVDILPYTIPQMQSNDAPVVEEMFVPEPMLTLDGPFSAIYLDAGTDTCHLLSRVEGILAFDIQSAVLEEQKSVNVMEYGTEITHFLVLDEGRTYITAERPSDSDSEDIYIYERDGEEWNRRLLCKYAGMVLKLEYEEAGKRLLIETGEKAETGAYMWSVERRVLVLEFE